MGTLKMLLGTLKMLLGALKMLLGALKMLLGALKMLPDMSRNGRNIPYIADYQSAYFFAVV
ncbi:MAG: hypothetical protein LBD21_05040 [Tannerellaceae bacterium]|nr:hypothetical protein [Tannerellaceae bacterium]